MHESIDGCRSCGSAALKDVLSLGNVPLADALLSDSDLKNDERRFPLNVAFCSDCSLVQIRETVAPEILFGDDYPYFSSFLPAWVDHCRLNAEELMETRKLDHDSLVVEIASNDGYMLRNFHDRGISTLGIDPVPGPAAAAEKLGIPTLRRFFGAQLAEELRAERSGADVIIGNNVLAHVADLRGFVRGISTLLKPEGIAVIEVPYVRELIDHCEFDTIYHEHLCYFSVTALNHLVSLHGLRLAEVRRLPTHGGSLRLFIEHGSEPSGQVQSLLAEESSAGLDSSRYYETFASRVSVLQSELVTLLERLRSSGHSIAAYGAAAKGTTLLNSSGVLPEHLDFVVDRNVHKHGRYMPGLQTPIYATERLLTERPDYVLLLAWNFKDEIIQQQSEYLSQGGRFIVPVPEVSIVDNRSWLSAAS
jgi:SAM-dependent methyltransferase